MYNPIDDLKRLNVEVPTLEELIGHSVTARNIRSEFEALRLEVPVWLDDVNRKLSREIHSRVDDSRQDTLKSLRAELDRLATPAERREKLTEQIRKLESRDVRDTQVPTSTVNGA